MKSVKQIIAETVNPPRGRDELRFIDKHKSQMKDQGHPVATDAQKSGGRRTKNQTRPSDMDDGKDVIVNEQKMSAVMVESVSVGKLTLGDNSKVDVSKSDADALRSLFNELSPANKKKMEQTMLRDEKGFAEILSFAKEAM